MSTHDPLGVEVSRHARSAGLPAGASVVLSAGAYALADHRDELLRNKRAGALAVSAICRAVKDGLSAEVPEVEVTISCVRFFVGRESRGLSGEPLGFTVRTFWEAELARRADGAERPAPAWRRWLS